MHANEELFPQYDGCQGKGFLDGVARIEKLAGMKNLSKLGMLLVLSGMLGSCGIPMAAVRTAQNTIKSAAQTLKNPLGQ